MPELPDVEGQRRWFEAAACGRQVRAVEAEAALVRNGTPADLERALRRRRFTRPWRHGKWLGCPTGGPGLLVHFGMTGTFCEADAEPHPHDRVTISLGGGDRIVYRSQRKLGGVWLAPGDAALRGMLARTGPDALEISRGRFREVLKGRRGGLKSALMDQAVLAGLGNLLADEVCWQARLAPGRKVAELCRGDLDALYATMGRVLRTSVRVGWVPPKAGWLTGVRDREDAACPRCGARLRRGTVAGRSTRWCPRCQA